MAARAYGKAKSWVIAVRCLTCRHRGVIAERDLVRFGITPGTPVANPGHATDATAKRAF